MDSFRIAVMKKGEVGGTLGAVFGGCRQRIGTILRIIVKCGS